MTNRRQPASSAAPTFGTTASGARGFDDEVGARQVGGIVAPAAGRPRRRIVGSARSARSSAAASTARPRPPSPRMSIVSMSCPFHSVWEGRRSGVPGHMKSRGHRRGAAAPGASVPWRPRFVVSDAPSEPQGPCLPAGPPELLLRLFREEAAVHRAIIRISQRCVMQACRSRGRACGTCARRGGDTHRRCPVSVTVRWRSRLSRARSSLGVVAFVALGSMAAGTAWSRPWSDLTGGSRVDQRRRTAERGHRPLPRRPACPRPLPDHPDARRRDPRCAPPLVAA